MTILPLPVGRDVTMDASWWTRMRGRVILFVGAILNRTNMTVGAIQPVTVEDAVTGWTFDVRVKGTAVVISIDGRDYTFNRLSGRFLGTGYATRPSCCRSDHIPRSNSFPAEHDRP